MSRKYFGTDGIRGRVGEAPVTADFAVRLGRAIGAVLARQLDGEAPKVLIGKDTRVSGYMLESALEAGLAAAGADVVLLGPMPTPAVAMLTRTNQADAGIVISASHNPFEDNGIKLFDARGEKLEDAVELEIEAEVDAPFVTVPPRQLGKAVRMDDARGRYLELLKTALDLRALRKLHGMRVVVDCAHGAAYRSAPTLLHELGFDVSAIAVEPDGFNINAGCGATDLTLLKHAVLERHAAIGLALDGDADRLQVVAADGHVHDGDDLLYALAKTLKAEGRLRGPVVGTVMTNIGIEQALKREGIGFARAAVGDRYVHQLLKSEGGNLGGEASGHVLFLDAASTGDGLLSALLLLQAMAKHGKSLAELTAGAERWPQRTINIRYQPGGVRPDRLPEVIAARDAAAAALGEDGRVILRASGTEPLIRVTVEARTHEMLDREIEALAELVRAKAG